MKKLFAVLTGLVLLGGIVGYNYVQNSNMNDVEETKITEDVDVVELDYEASEDIIQQYTNLKLAYALDDAKHNMVQSGYYYDLICTYLNDVISKSDDEELKAIYSYQVFVADEPNEDGTIECIYVGEYDNKYESEVSKGDADINYIVNYLNENVNQD